MNRDEQGKLSTPSVDNTEMIFFDRSYGKLFQIPLVLEETRCFSQTHKFCLLHSDPDDL